MSPVHDAEALAILQGRATAPDSLPPLPPELVREQLAHDSALMQWSSDAI